MKLHLSLLVVGRMLLATVGSRPMPIAQVDGKVWLREYVNLTGGLYHPVILKGLIDTTHPELQKICNCEAEPSMFDLMDIPYSPGNAKTAMYFGVEPKPMNGGQYWRDLACKSENMSYVAYESTGRYANDYLNSTKAFFEKLTEVMDLRSKIFDREFLSGDTVSNEYFLGRSPSDVHPDHVHNSRVTAGSDVHQGDVHNYYIHFCGTKKWRISDRGVVFGTERDTTFYSGQHLGEEEQATWHAYDGLFEGITGPGDVLLNPVWLWHDAWAVPGSGMQFAVTYKWHGKRIKDLMAEQPEWKTIAGMVSDASIDFELDKARIAARLAEKKDADARDCTRLFCVAAALACWLASTDRRLRRKGAHQTFSDFGFSICVVAVPVAVSCMWLGKGTLSMP